VIVMARHGRQPIADLRRMSVRDFWSAYRALTRLLIREAPPKRPK
jgi:hypothetical protein